MLRWCCWLELCVVFFFFSSRRRHTRCSRDWSSDVCSSDLAGSLDVDKLDYLSRDAWMCGVPYGVIDVDRLLMSLTVAGGDRKSTRLNSSHGYISYAVFCLKKKNTGDQGVRGPREC